MLRVLIHSGHLGTRNPGNLLATLDIAYQRQDAWSDYTVAFSHKGTGSVETDEVKQYPRWAGSMWDLVARALTRILYRKDQAPPSPTPDRRCAYATKTVVWSLAPLKSHRQATSEGRTRRISRKTSWVVVQPALPLA